MRYPRLGQHIAVEARQGIGSDTVVEHTPAADASIHDAQSDAGGSKAAGQDIRPTPVLVDAGTARVVSAEGLPWYLRALEISRPLHFGDYGGLLLKIIWALFDFIAIIVLGSGLYLWILRRTSHRRDELSLSWDGV